jgi:hypothetical protein
MQQPGIGLKIFPKPFQQAGGLLEFFFFQHEPHSQQSNAPCSRFDGRGAFHGCGQPCFFLACRQTGIGFSMPAAHLLS